MVLSPSWPSATLGRASYFTVWSLPLRFLSMLKPQAACEVKMQAHLTRSRSRHCLAPSIVLTTSESSKNLLRISYSSSQTHPSRCNIPKLDETLTTMGNERPVKNGRISTA